MPTRCISASRRLIVLLGLFGVPMLAGAATIDVTVQNDDGSGATPGTLSWAIQSANDAGAGPHRVTLRTDVRLTGRMRRLIEQSVTIAGDAPGRVVACDAGSGGQPFWIGGKLAGTSHNGVAYPAAADLTVTLRGFRISGCVARGGNGGGVSNNGGGGGGAGMGGAIFVYHGRVTLQHLDLIANVAQGGSAAARPDASPNGGGGGGMAGYASDITAGGLWSGQCGGLGAYACAGNGGFGEGGGGWGGGGNGGYNAFDGGSGGFGGGGGGGAFNGAAQNSAGGLGGFGGGGGGGAAVGVGARGGFGAGAGLNGIVPGRPLPPRGGGGGAGGGMGGAVFVRAGTLTLENVAFSDNSAQSGSGYTPGAGFGGALFVCTADLDSDGARGAQDNCAAVIDTANSCGVRFAGNSAASGQPNYYWSNHMTALDGLPACPPSGPASQLVVDPDLPTMLYAGLDGAGVFSKTGSGNWTAASAQPGNLQVRALARKSGTPLYAGSYGSGVYKAAAGTTAFAACNAQPASQYILSLALDASGKLYAGTEAGVFASSDQCATWTPMNTGLPN